MSWRASASASSVGEIVRTATSLSTADPDDLGSSSVLLERVIDPAVRRAGETFLANLDAITVEQMCETAEERRMCSTMTRRSAAQFRYLMARPPREGTRAKAATLHAISRRADKRR